MVGAIYEKKNTCCGMYIPLSDDKHQMVRDSSKNALASTDAIVTQLLRYHMPLLYFVCNHLIVYVLKDTGKLGETQGI